MHHNATLPHQLMAAMQELASKPKHPRSGEGKVGGKTGGNDGGRDTGKDGGRDGDMNLEENAIMKLNTQVRSVGTFMTAHGASLMVRHQPTISASFARSDLMQKKNEGLVGEVLFIIFPTNLMNKVLWGQFSFHFGCLSKTWNK